MLHNPSQSFINLPPLFVRNKRLKKLYAFFLQKVPKKAKNVTPTLHRHSYADRKLKGLYAFFEKKWFFLNSHPTHPTHITHLDM